jgi:hypothetical protein
MLVLGRFLIHERELAGSKKKAFIASNMGRGKPEEDRICFQELWPSVLVPENTRMEVG